MKIIDDFVYLLEFNEKPENERALTPELEQIISDIAKTGYSRYFVKTAYGYHRLNRRCFSLLKTSMGKGKTCIDSKVSRNNRSI